MKMLDKRNHKIYSVKTSLLHQSLLNQQCKFEVILCVHITTKAIQPSWSGYVETIHTSLKVKRNDIKHMTHFPPHWTTQPIHIQHLLSILSITFETLITIFVWIMLAEGNLKHFASVVHDTCTVLYFLLWFSQGMFVYSAFDVKLKFLSFVESSCHFSNDWSLLSYITYICPTHQHDCHGCM